MTSSESMVQTNVAKIMPIRISHEYLSFVPRINVLAVATMAMETPVKTEFNEQNVSFAY